MNLTINTYNTPSFMARRINITKEQILALRAAGKKETEIPQALGISTATYYVKLKKLGIPSKIEAFNNELSKISKEEFESLLKRKAPIDEICKIFKITTNAYYTMVERLGLRNYIVGVNKRAVTKEKLQELVDKNMPIDDICKELSIGKDAYYELVQKFDIKTTLRASKDRIAAISKETVVDLINSGKTYQEICSMLGISEASLRNLISKFNIETKVIKTKKIKAEITKEVLESLINEGKQVPEICKELNIAIRQYSELVHKFGIMTKLRQGKANIAKVTREELQELVDKGFSVEQICRKLKITNSAFYHLLKRLDIRYNYKHHANEIYIPKEKLKKTVEDWTSADDIQDKLGVSSTTFYEKAKNAKVKTLLSDSIKKINEANLEEIQELLDKGVHWKEICKMYNLTESNYHILVRKYNLVSSSKTAFQNAQNITKEQLEELINSGKQTKEICQELKISGNTLRKKINKFGLKSKN